MAINNIIINNTIRELSSSFKCQQCGNCCNTCDIVTVSKTDAKRIARSLKLPERVIHKRYLKHHPLHYKDGDYSFIHTKPCTFYDIQTKTCKIYDARPDVCRVYPFSPDSFKVDNRNDTKENRNDTKENRNNTKNNTKDRIHVNIPYNCPGYKELAVKLNIKIDNVGDILNQNVQSSIQMVQTYQPSQQTIKPQIVIDNYQGGFHNKDLEKSRERLSNAKTYKDLSTICVIPTRGMIHFKVVQNWMGLMPPMNQKFLRMFISGMEVGAAYNAAIEMILANPELSNWKYLLTMEEDNCPPPDGLLKLYENMDKYDVVEGLYWTKGEGGQPMIYGDPKSIPLNFVPQIPIPDTVQECNGLGMGFNLFKIDIFKDPKIPKPFFKTCQEYIPYQGVKAYTQDLYFFENIHRLGYKVACDTRIKVGHYDAQNDIMW